MAVVVEVWGKSLLLLITSCVPSSRCFRFVCKELMIKTVMKGLLVRWVEIQLLWLNERLCLKSWSYMESSASFVSWQESWRWICVQFERVSFAFVVVSTTKKRWITLRLKYEWGGWQVLQLTKVRDETDVTQVKRWVQRQRLKFLPVTWELITIPRFAKSFTCTSVCDTGFYFGILARKRVTDKELSDRGEEEEEQDQYWTSLSNFCRISFFQQDSLLFNHLLVIWFLCCCFSQCIQLHLSWTIFFLISLLSPTGHSLSFGIWWWIVVGCIQVWQKESKLLDLRRDRSLTGRRKVLCLSPDNRSEAKIVVEMMFFLVLMLLSLCVLWSWAEKERSWVEEGGKNQILAQDQKQNRGRRSDERQVNGRERCFLKIVFLFFFVSLLQSLERSLPTQLLVMGGKWSWTSSVGTECPKFS